MKKIQKLEYDFPVLEDRSSQVCLNHIRQLSKLSFNFLSIVASFKLGKILYSKARFGLKKINLVFYNCGQYSEEIPQFVRSIYHLEELYITNLGTFDKIVLENLKDILPKLKRLRKFELSLTCGINLSTDRKSVV